MSRRQTAHRKRANGRERKALDRAVLRLTRTLFVEHVALSERETKEWLGLVAARRRVAS